ncbi:unnamed protein product, partial [Rotaria sordida]
TVEMYYSAKRQSFLINQGYSYKVITRLVSEEDNLFYSTKEEQRQLLERVLLATDRGEDKEEESLGQVASSTTSVDRRVGTMNSLSGADATTYMEVKKKPITNGTARSNKPKHELFRKYRTNINNSLFQDIFIDTIRDYLLFIRCLLENWQINDTCKYYWNNIIYIKIFILSLIMLLCDLPTKYQIEPVKKNAKLIVFTLIIVWFSTRFFNVLKLPYFSFTLHQASLCIFTAFISYASYDIVLRYLPVQYKFILLWFIAIQDCIACLYVHGRLYNSMLVVLPESPLINGFLLDPCCYYVDDPRDDKIDDESFIVTIGLGDFTFYNLMVLFVLSPLSLMIDQIYVTIGAIISVQIGYMAMKWTPTFWNKNKSLPALPLPIIAYSAYAILIDTFMQNSNSDIC